MPDRVRLVDVSQNPEVEILEGTMAEHATADQLILAMRDGQIRVDRLTPVAAKRRGKVAAKRRGKAHGRRRAGSEDGAEE